MTAKTLGHILIQDILPKEYHSDNEFTKKHLYNILTQIAKKQPDQYPHVVTSLKKLGDDFSTTEGISVGLDDISPDYVRRDAILNPALKEYNSAKTDKERERILIESQNKILDFVKNEATGTLAAMSRSGSRGNATQLMKINSSPVLSTGDKDKVNLRFLTKSYSEGLSPADIFSAATESRINAIKSNLSVTEPGDLSKILINNMSDKLVTEDDCHTTNGLSMSTKDPHIIDRYLAHASGKFKAQTLITPQIGHELSQKEDKVIVRSPMTCQSKGVCKKCYGLDSYGNEPVIGINLGLRASQSLAEPLTQLALSSKHGGKINTKDLETPSLPLGISGLRQFIEIPESFMNKAALADHDGKVTRIEKAPQGGSYVYVNDTKHYVTPKLKVLVSEGQKVEAGDVLSQGIPKPNEIVKHKGLGVGRDYLVKALHNLYAKSGNDIDKRHLEIMGKSLMNYVYVTDTQDADDHEFLKGDVVNYNKYSEALAKTKKSVDLSEAHGELMATPILHFTAGTRITDSVVNDLAKHNFKTVDIATGGPKVEFYMKPATRTPLLNPDWMARLGHRYLKDSLLHGVHYGDVSDLHGALPIPSYVVGTEFGRGEDGKY